MSSGTNCLRIVVTTAKASTSKGVPDRLVLGMALAIWAAALIFAFVRQQGNARLSVVAALIGGALVSLIPYLKDRK